MSVVRKTHAARTDLRELWIYIAAENENAANALLDRIDTRLGKVAINPSIGTPRPDLGARFRGAVEGRYLLIYQPIDDGIRLLRVLHGARDVGSAIRR